MPGAPSGRGINLDSDTANGIEPRGEVNVRQKLDTGPVGKRQFFEFCGNAFRSSWLDINCDHKIDVGAFTVCAFGAGTEQRSGLDFRMEP